MNPLSLNVRLLKAMALWPENSDGISNKTFIIKHILVILSLAPSCTTSLLGAARQLNNLDDINILIDQLIGLCALIACVYMCECFVKSIQHVRDLTEEIKNFGIQFNAQNALEQTEMKIQTYTKVFIY